MEIRYLGDVTARFRACLQRDRLPLAFIACDEAAVVYRRELCAAA